MRSGDKRCWVRRARPVWLILTLGLAGDIVVKRTSLTTCFEWTGSPQHVGKTPEVNESRTNSLDDATRVEGMTGAWPLKWTRRVPVI